MDTFCLSCGMPVSHDEKNNSQRSFCQYCTDDKGMVKSKEEIQAGMAAFLKSWAPDKNADFMSRAEHMMKAMPHWADQ